jgi:hypothetical protein
MSRCPCERLIRERGVLNMRLRGMNAIHPAVFQLVRDVLGGEEGVRTGRWVRGEPERKRNGLWKSQIGLPLLRGGCGIVMEIQKAAHFRPPADLSAPLIMVGPGTGIAPFIAFLQERRATAAGGKNWLFFGEQHEATDFYYREELAEMLESGLLHRLDTAFSRDQE